MKKVISAIIAGVMCLSTATTALAADTVLTPDTTQPAETTVNYSVAADYEVVIPESVEIGGELIISSAKANTEPNMAVKVAVNGLVNNKAELARVGDTATKIYADIKQNGSDIAENAVIAEFADVTAETKADAIIVSNPQTADGSEIKAGRYMGTLTFTVSYENA